METSRRLSIGDLAKATGVKVVTIRYYEEAGLLKRPGRTVGNYRSYDGDHTRQLRFIRRCRDLGFTLDQVRALLRISSHQDHECGEIDQITTSHLMEIENKIADLTRLATELRRISRSCNADRRVSDCRILEALSPD